MFDSLGQVTFDELGDFPELWSACNLPFSVCAAIDIAPHTPQYKAVIAFANVLGFNGSEMGAYTLSVLWLLVERLATAGPQVRDEPRQTIEDSLSVNLLGLMALAEDFGLMENRLVDSQLSSEPLRVRQIPTALRKTIVRNLHPKIQMLLREWSKQGVFPDTARKPRLGRHDDR